MGRFKHATVKKPQQILFSKNTYGPGVKVEHWDYRLQTEPKDNYVYRDNLSNHLSTYLRMGQDSVACSTETADMLAQISTKVNPIYTYKALVNFTSYPCTE